MLEIMIAATQLANEPLWRLLLVAALIIAGIVMLLTTLIGFVVGIVVLVRLLSTHDSGT